jgi:sodium/potassium-transporting ATPase subunit alpha
VALVPYEDPAASRSRSHRRLRELGPNLVPEVAREPPWLRLLKQFVHFFSLILWVAAGVAFVAEWSAPGQGMAKIGYAIEAVIVVSGVFSFWQEYRVEQTLAVLRKLLPQEVKVLRDGKVIQGSAEQFVPGDIILLERCARHHFCPRRRRPENPRQRSTMLHFRLTPRRTRQ